MSSSAEDARQRTKVYLETYLTAANLLVDAGVDQVKFIVFFSNPNYPVARMFTDKFVDLSFAIGEPESKGVIDSDHYTIGYDEHVPITIYAMDKEGITADKLKWQAERELRRVVETYPIATGSSRGLLTRSGLSETFGGKMLRSSKWILNYKRDTT